MYDKAGFEEVARRRPGDRAGASAARRGLIEDK